MALAGAAMAPASGAVQSRCFLVTTPSAHTHTHTHTHTHDGKTNGHNSGSECQNHYQLDRQTRQSMSDANRCLSVAKVMGTHGYASWGMHYDLHEEKGGLRQHRSTRSLQRR